MRVLTVAFGLVAAGDAHVALCTGNPDQQVGRPSKYNTPRRNRRGVDPVPARPTARRQSGCTGVGNLHRAIIGGGLIAAIIVAAGVWFEAPRISDQMASAAADKEYADARALAATYPAASSHRIDYTRDTLAQAVMGKTKAQVRSILGEPDHVHDLDDGDEWVYDDRTTDPELVVHDLDAGTTFGFAAINFNPDGVVESISY